MQRAFVVQEHRLHADEVHFDLMIEDEDVLVTFQLDVAPAPGGASGQRSFDHRRIYLSYEGPVSGDRGHVRIWDQGTVTDVEGTPRDPSYRLRFAGQHLAGEWSLREHAGGVQLGPLL
jgi:hypothetical protein